MIVSQKDYIYSVYSGLYMNSLIAARLRSSSAIRVSPWSMATRVTASAMRALTSRILVRAG